MQGITYPVGSLPSVTEDIFIRFVTHCQRSLSLRYNTIKLYLAGVRFHYIRHNMGDPLANTLRLPYILRAIQRTDNSTTNSRFPITCDILFKMCNVLKSECRLFDPFMRVMLQCVFKTAFYGFLRCGEFTCLSLTDSLFIRIQDITLVPDNSMFLLYLRSSKTDPFGKGVTIKIFENCVLNPVSTMHTYVLSRLAQGASPASPLFIDSFCSKEGEVKPLMRSSFITYLKETLTLAGIDHTSYNGHSFRIGAATSAAAAGVEDHLIQTLGRWSSTCYVRYIRTDPSIISIAQHNMSLLS